MILEEQVGFLLPHWLIFQDRKFDWSSTLQWWNLTTYWSQISWWLDEQDKNKERIAWTLIWRLKIENCMLLNFLYLNTECYHSIFSIVHHVIVDLGGPSVWYKFGQIKCESSKNSEFLFRKVDELQNSITIYLHYIPIDLNTFFAISESIFRRVETKTKWLNGF